MMKKMLLSMLCATALHVSYGQLPVWPLVTAHPNYLDPGTAGMLVPNQFIDWTGVSPSAVPIPGTGSHNFASAQAGVNGCNQMVFFVLHNGELAQPNSFLRLFTPTGIYMPLPVADMNANAGDDEVQVIRRPGVPNQWFVIYTLAPVAFPSGHPGYQTSLLAYSLIEVNGNTATYVTDGGGDIRDRVLDVGGIQHTYIHGKGTSRQSVMTGYNHDIYIQRRQQSNINFVIDRFSVGTGTSVDYTGSSAVQTEYWWGLMASGSPIELSPDNQRLAVLARSQNDGEEQIYIFDISTAATLGNPPDAIDIEELQIEFPAVPPPPLPGTFHSAGEFDAPTTATGMLWLRNFENKISAMEFSPSGQYLYIVGGGFVNGGQNNITYLGQIDLTATVGINHPVRLQVQWPEPSPPFPPFNVVSGGGMTWTTLNYANYWPSHHISNIESCFDGNLYFTKINSEEIFVLPQPDNPMAIDMVPHEVDLTPLFPGSVNIATDGYAVVLPDQIDGFDYSLTNFTTVTLVVSNQNLCSCDTLDVVVTNAAGDTIGGFQINDCPDTVTVCVPVQGTFTLEGSNGVNFPGAIVNGTVVYPAGTTLFGFGSASGMPGGASFTVINGLNNYINSDQIWEGKYFIEDNTILTVDGALLDLTNVDIVFGSCAGIDFINGSYMRGNNSVFRPCEVDGTWRGLQFTGIGIHDNIINECTFKNAEAALYFYSDADGVISNNLFSNCNEGVRVVGVSPFNHPISGNRFLADDFYPRFRDCYGFVAPDFFYGIYLSGTEMTAEISHNDFICSKNDDPLASTGVIVAVSNAMISENTFTNMRNPIILSRPKNTFVDNNEIEYNNDFVAYVMATPTSGIYVNQAASLVEMANNEIRDNSSSSVASYGIYVAGSQRVSARRNMIEGFDIGINFNKSFSIEITENVLTNPVKTGIYFNDANRQFTNYITCNDITMYHFVGTGIQTTSANERTRIISNCVKDSRNGIHCSPVSGSGDRIPFIRNNYLYNYGTGIYNNSHTGNIGSAGDPGQNTLWSNNNAAFDIAGTIGSSITVGDNFGMFNIQFPEVMITSNNPYHSTASCGHQIFNMPSQGNLNTEWHCDNSEAVYDPMQHIERTITLGSNDLTGALAESEYPLTDLISIIRSLTDLDEQEVAAFIPTRFTDPNDRNLAFYELYLRTGKYDMAAQYLSVYVPADADGELCKTLESMYLNVILDPAFSLDEQIGMLKLIAEDKGPLAHIATTLLQFTHEHVLYPYLDTEEADISQNLSITHIEEDGLLVQAYPNPVHDIVTLNIITDAEVSDYMIGIRDISGKQIAAYPVQFVAGQVQLDVSHVSSGVYFISLYNNTNSTTVKFIKD